MPACSTELHYLDYHALRSKYLSRTSCLLALCWPKAIPSMLLGGPSLLKWALHEFFAEKLPHRTARKTVGSARQLGSRPSPPHHCFHPSNAFGCCNRTSRRRSVSMIGSLISHIRASSILHLLILWFDCLLRRMREPWVLAKVVSRLCVHNRDRQFLHKVVSSLAFRVSRRI